MDIINNFTDFADIAPKILIPVCSVLLLLRCFYSMMKGNYKSESWGVLRTAKGETLSIDHWECIIGRGKGCDIILPDSELSLNHAALSRDGRGGWRFFSLSQKEDCGIISENRELIIPDKKGIPIKAGDKIVIGKNRFTFIPQEGSSEGSVRPVGHGVSLLLLTAINFLLVWSYARSLSYSDFIPVAICFGIQSLLQLSYYLIMRSIDRSGIETEILMFFLISMGNAIMASCNPGGMYMKQLFNIVGLMLYLFLGWWLRDIRRSRKLRYLAALAAIGLIAANVLFGMTQYGAKNWIAIGPFSFQPSEFVKVLFIYTGSAPLAKLFGKRNIFWFTGFSACCVGAFALLGDFGTALIFFIAFLVIAFMRSGSFATVIFAIASAGIVVFLVITAKPYILQRFSVWGHIWDYSYNEGWQQCKALSAAASGGLLGKGAGLGFGNSIFAAETDIVFCVLAEELGLITAACSVMVLPAITFFTVRCASRGRSAYYVIASCAACAMMTAQLCLNVFGSCDLLPFTGVTFPFVSDGGSSLLSCWCLMAFIKSADTRPLASFSVSAWAKNREEDD